MKKWPKKLTDNKEPVNHSDRSKKSSMNTNLREKWSKLMHSTHNKLSEGASQFSRAIRSRGGSNSKISGREHEKGHHSANPRRRSSKKK